MLFPTVEFGIFFLVVFAAHWATVRWPLPNKVWLTLASYVFYGWWDFRFTLLLFQSSIVNWALGLWIGEETRPSRRRAVLVLAVTANLVTLGFFKYWGFFWSSLLDLLRAFGVERDAKILEVLLPVGVSFFTFHGISYVVDVYKRRLAPSRNPLDLMLYVSFFPHLVAGPIVRAGDFLPQLAKTRHAGGIPATRALLLIGGGLFKKIVIAHYLAVQLVNPVFEAPDVYGAFDTLMAVYGYALQIYCDFSAYTDMAIGLAALLGFTFPRNFDQPYRALSLSEFWRRWHISLSSFLRDYLYIPLGGSRQGGLATYRNLMITMVLGGLWHGAAWTFVVWGILHGTGLSFERWLSERGIALAKDGFGRIMRAMLTFHFVCFAWIFFNADNFPQALKFLAALGNVGTKSAVVTPFLVCLLLLGVVGQFLPSNTLDVLEQRLARIPLVAQAAGLSLAVIAIAALGPGALAPFIYFRF